jgi:mannose-6-phosphate isomerase-like protein (cupin superfamily)
MVEHPIYIKKGDEKTKTDIDGKLYRLMIKSKQMEAIIAELNPQSESDWFKHEGEEIHLVIKGKMEFSVGHKIFKLNEGDVLWHKSIENHRAKNVGNEKVIYLTVGLPPKLMWSTQ